MKRIAFFALAAAIIALAASQSSAQNLAANPGFEDPIVDMPPPFTGRWHPFSGGPGATAANSTVFPFEGTSHLDLSIDNVNNTFAGVFQDITGLTPGSPTSFQAMHFTPAGSSAVAEIRVEWRNSASNTEVTRAGGVLHPFGFYQGVNLAVPVPPGADTARLVFAIQTFDNVGPDTGSIYIDNVSFTVVPEPATIALAAFSSLGLIAVHRRRR